MLTLRDIKVLEDDYVRKNFRIGLNISEVPGMCFHKGVYIVSGEKCYIRIIPKAKIESDEDESRILTEIHILSNFSHPGIGKLICCFQDICNYYNIIERFRGETLSKRLLREHNELTVCSYMMQILSFLHYMHLNKIAYRVLTLDNIRFTSNADDAVMKFQNFYYSFKVPDGESLAERVTPPVYRAPEQIRRRYGVKSDWWSAGVILYIMLTGTQPFNGQSETTLYRRINERDCDFSAPIWSTISSEAKDLIENLLKVEPDERISPEAALSSPWFSIRNIAMPSKEISANYIIALSQFHCKEKYKKGLCKFTSLFFIRENENTGLMALFNYLDLDKNGFLTKEELLQGLPILFGKKIRNLDNEVDKILTEAGVGETEGIDYNYFVSAAIGYQKLYERKKLESLFNVIDLDGNKKIEFSELKLILSRYISIDDEAEAQRFFDQYDLNKDGALDLEEFIKLMQAR